MYEIMRVIAAAVLVYSYSALKAISGSTRVARRAGINVAASPVRASEVKLSVKTHGSHGVI